MYFGQKEPIKVQILKILSAQVKIHQIAVSMFKRQVNSCIFYFG